MTRGRVLVTGGAGYIGSHCVVELVNAGFTVAIADNLCNSSAVCIDRLRIITGKPDAISFHLVDVCDSEAFEREVFQKYSEPFVAAMHFASLKAVGESIAIPLKYYSNNLKSIFSLLELMEKYKCFKIVFSSSATVYGTASVPYTEESPAGIGITNPYGQTKFMIEQILKDFFASMVKSSNPWSISILRYFNPVGAHSSGLIGEDPMGIPNNLMPYIAQVSVGRLPFLKIYGKDYETCDGTGVRDYIHVVDLATGHLAALDHLVRCHPTLDVYNLGSGNGISVLQLLKAMEEACGHPLKYEFVDRRPGDLAVSYAKAEKAKIELGWETKKTVQDMCQDTWRWQSKNPKGFAS